MVWNVTKESATGPVRVAAYDICRRLRISRSDRTLFKLRARRGKAMAGHWRALVGSRGWFRAGSRTRYGTVLLN